MSDSSAARVLIVDDEPDLRSLLTFNLELAGFEVQAVANGRDGLDASQKRRPDVVILDIMLPDVSGTEICRAIRSSTVSDDVAVLMLTARGDEGDRLLGFEVGADDYVVKPFSVREVIMRVKVLARRNRGTAAKQPGEADGDTGLRWKDLELSRVKQSATSGGTEISLRPLEYKLLSIFLEHPGRVFSRADLLQEVWGISPGTNTRTVDVHVRRLRARLGAWGDMIETIHGVGYRLRDPAR